MRKNVFFSKIIFIRYLVTRTVIWIKIQKIINNVSLENLWKHDDVKTCLQIPESIMQELLIRGYRNEHLFQTFNIRDKISLTFYICEHKIHKLYFNFNFILF